MTERSTALALLRRQLADDAALCRDGQWEAIDSIVNGRWPLALATSNPGE